MKALLVLPIAIALLMTSCTTLQNRRYLWEPQKIEGPYTRMLAKKPWPWPRQAETQESTPAAPPSEGQPWGK